MNTEKSLFDNLADEINASTEIPEVIKKKLLTNIMKSKAEPVNLLITGPTGCGKSSTINAMFNMEVAKVGVGVDPETMDIKDFKLGNLTIYDSPGLGDSKENDIEHKNKITELLNRTDDSGNALIDLVLVIVDGSSKDLGTTFELIETVIVPALGEERHSRLLIAVNQADVAMRGGNHWNRENNCPDEELTEFLNDKIENIKDRIKLSTGIDVNPIFYSAGYKEKNTAQAPPYNLSKLMMYILKAIPARKRLVIANNANPEKRMWIDSENPKTYNTEIYKALIESVCEGIETGKDIGESFGGIIGSLFGVAGKKVGEAIGKVAGGFLGAIGGLIFGLLD